MIFLKKSLEISPEHCTFVDRDIVLKLNIMQNMSRWLKIIVVFLVFAISVVYAQKHLGGQQHKTSDVKIRVENIYNHVAKEYNKCNESSEFTIPNNDIFDELYCSTDWNATLKKALESQPDSDDIGLFEFDYWIFGQDFGSISVTDVKVTKLEGDSAVVMLNLHNLGSVNKINLKMVYERDNWYIDDMCDSFEYDSINSLKHYMREYITENQQ